MIGIYKFKNINLGILFFSFVLAISILFYFIYGSEIEDFVTFFRSFINIFRIYFFGIDALYLKC